MVALISCFDRFMVVSSRLNATGRAINKPVSVLQHLKTLVGGCAAGLSVGTVGNSTPRVARIVELPGTGAFRHQKSKREGKGKEIPCKSVRTLRSILENIWRGQILSASFLFYSRTTGSWEVGDVGKGRFGDGFRLSQLAEECWRTLLVYRSRLSQTNTQSTMARVLGPLEKHVGVIRCGIELGINTDVANWIDDSERPARIRRL